MEARAIAGAIGFPVLVRPSYVLGGRAMRLVHDHQDLDAYMREAVTVSPEHPVLIDKFLEDSLEIDVDAVADGERVVVGGVMEHVEKAGIHSGDAACALPPYSLGDDQVQALRAQTKALARALDVVGLINVQFAIRNDTIYVLEVNPRASRTVPFVSKVIGVPLAKIATRAMLGHSIADIGHVEERELPHIAVKEAVFPFIKFPGVDMVLGPEMKSTGEVMGIDVDFRQAYLKSQLAADSPIPASGKVFISVKNRDKRHLMPLAKRLVDMGFSLVATSGTARVLERHGMEVEHIHKVVEGYRPNALDLMKRGEIVLVFNTPEDGRARQDSYMIRRTAVTHHIPYYLTVDGVQAAVGAIEALLKGEQQVRSLQEYHLGPGDRSGRRPAPRRPRRGLAGRAEALLDRLQGVVTRLQDRLPALHRGRAGRRRAPRTARLSRLPGSEVPRHPEHGGRRRAGGDPARRLHADRPRQRRAGHDARGGRGGGHGAPADFAVARPLCLGITVLTSLDRRALQAELRVRHERGRPRAPPRRPLARGRPGWLRRVARGDRPRAHDHGPALGRS